MFIYNVTVKVEEAIADNWLNWLLQEHAPSMLQTGCFTGFQVVRLLEVDDQEGPTYAIQYRTASLTDYHRYQELFAARMREDSFHKWGDRFVAFRSLMEVVQ